MGALRFSDQKRFVEFVKKGDSKNFYEALKIFYEEQINEGVSAGNRRKDFEEKSLIIKWDRKLKNKGNAVITV